MRNCSRVARKYSSCSRPSAGSTPPLRVSDNASLWRLQCPGLQLILASETRKRVISTRHGGGSQLSCLGEVTITWDLLRGGYNLLGLELGCKTAPYSSGGSSIVSSYAEKAKKASEFLKGSQDLSDAGGSTTCKSRTTGVPVVTPRSQTKGPEFDNHGVHTG